MNTLTPADYTFVLRPHEVEYRLVVGQGVRVVKATFHFVEPRIMFWSERPSHEGVSIVPMSMSLTEIEQFVTHARHVLEEGGQ